MTTTISLQDKLKEYRKQARLSQGLLGQIIGYDKRTVSDFELYKTVPTEFVSVIKRYLAEAPRPRKDKTAPTNRPKNIYLTTKLLTWANITGMTTDGIEAVRAIKDAYETAKREQGLASIPLIQLEVENALTLATRGAYRKAINGRTNG